MFGAIVALVAMGFLVSGALVLMAGPNQSIDWERPETPTAAEIEDEVRQLPPGPVFWFGPGREAFPFSAVGLSVQTDSPAEDALAAFFTYDLFCEEMSRGNLTCEDGGEVQTEDRAPLSLTTSRRACWVQVGPAWLLDCPGHDAEYRGPRLLTGRRVVRFAIREGRRDTALRPWRESLGRLQRRGAAGRGEAILLPTARLTRSELAALGPAARAAVPDELRPSTRR